VIALTREDRILSAVIYALLGLVLLAVAYPLYFIVIASMSAPSEVNTGGVWLFPKGFTLEGYRRIFSDSQLLGGYRNSLLYTVAGTSLNLVLTLTGAYALSRKDMFGRGFFMGMLAFTMFFSGGLIPLYLLITRMHLYNTFLVMILPNAVSVWNIVIARTFYQSNIPDELHDAGVIDGCSDFRFFASVVVPLSAALTAVLTVFYAVGHWNAYFNGLIYLKSRERFPLQLILREILIQNQFQADQQVDDVYMAEAQMLAESIKYGVIIVASVPVLILYPFVQRHFVKGVMVGAIKG
jgi:putative aldouronate transport system permease protein